MTSIFEIEQKTDSPEKLAAVEGKPTEYYLFSGEWNSLKEVALQNLIDNLQMSFYWGVDTGYSFLTPLQGWGNNLGIHINNKEIFEHCKIILFIDRYRPKRMVRYEPFTDLRYSGFKHTVPNIETPGRKTEILLNTNNEIINFGQETFFKREGNIVKAKGFSSKANSKNDTQAQIYLQFRLKLEFNGKEYFSKPLGKIRMFCVAHLDGNSNISFKLI